MKIIRDELRHVPSAGARQHQIPFGVDVKAAGAYGFELRQTGKESFCRFDDLRRRFGEQEDDGIGVKLEEHLAIDLGVVFLAAGDVSIRRQRSAGRQGNCAGPR